MSEVGVFDIASLYNTSAPDGTWYIQNTTGTAVPAPRVEFCLVSHQRWTLQAITCKLDGHVDLNHFRLCTERLKLHVRRSRRREQLF